jgi:hypothetical protein
MLVKLRVLAVISGLAFLLLSIASPEQASAAGKFDGEWKGECFCIVVKYDPLYQYYVVEGTEVIFPFTLIVYNGSPNVKFFPSQNSSFRVELEQTGSIKISGNHPKYGALELEGKLPDNEVGKERFVRLLGELRDVRKCDFYLTWSDSS